MPSRSHRLARKALARQTAEAEAQPTWEHQKSRLQAIERLSAKLAM